MSNKITFSEFKDWLVNDLIKEELQGKIPGYAEWERIKEKLDAVQELAPFKIKKDYGTTISIGRTEIVSASTFTPEVIKSMELINKQIQKKVEHELAMNAASGIEPNWGQRSVTKEENNGS